MKRDRAKELLRHYLRLACEPEGCELDFDCYAEIDEIVDAIIEAAVAEVMARVERGVSSAIAYVEKSQRARRADHAGPAG